MPTKSKHPRLRKLLSTLPTDGRLQSSSVPHQLLTKSGQPSHLSAQNADGSQASIPNTSQSLKPISSVKGNDPQLLAVILKATISAMVELKLLTVIKTQSGKLAIILSTDLFNDDLTLKASNK